MKLGKRGAIRHLLLFFIVCQFVSCKPTPEELSEKYTNEMIRVSGIRLDKQVLNDFFAESGAKGVTVSQFVEGLNVKIQEKKSINSAQVIVDMSAGMNVGIDRSFKAITAVLQRFNPSECAYYHVDDNASIDRIAEIKSLSDAGILQNPANYKKSYSKLRPAFESASRSGDKISVIITDFLLDEGIKAPRRLKNGKYTSDESADISTWASEYFTQWLNGRNRLLIYPFTYTAPNYYQKPETKKIYYILFIPADCKNAKLDDLLRDFGGIFPEAPIDINPAAISLHIDETTLPGNCVEKYNLIKTPGNKPTVFREFASQQIPYDFQAVLQNAYAGKPVACNMSIENHSPFDAEIAADVYDISRQYYKALQTSEQEFKGKEFFKELKPVNDLELVRKGDTLSFAFGTAVTRENYLSAAPSKLLCAKVWVKKTTPRALPASLSWDFESKYGTMVNDALSQSLRLALDDFIKKNPEYQIGSLLISVNGK